MIRGTVGDIYLGQSLLRIHPPRIAGSSIPERWSIEPVGEGVFRIAFPYSDGVVSLPDRTPGTQLTAPPWEGMEWQKWYFETQ